MDLKALPGPHREPGRLGCRARVVRIERPGNGEPFQSRENLFAHRLPAVNLNHSGLPRSGYDKVYSAASVAAPGRGRDQDPDRSRPTGVASSVMTGRKLMISAAARGLR